MKEQQFFSSVSPKGQITLPGAIRKALGIKPKDQMAIVMDDGMIIVQPLRSRLVRHYQKAGALKEPLSWKEIEAIAHEEHAQRVAREGLGP
jgi:AbrB family looped-hinge helix DNA binding protein